ncbi:MAG: hypothetical protein M0Z45_00190 [Actinomycetota bacterium]|nr:hypothetical protein [Actinomycetota bacterium]
MRWFRRSAIVPIALVTGPGLTAWRSSPSVALTTTSTAPSDQVTYLCHVIPRVHRLIVTRHAPGNQFHFTFPAVVAVTNAAAAQAVATSACALPDTPKGAQHRHAEFYVSYHLVFAVRGEKGLGGEAIDVNPTDCQGVTGLGTVREAISHPVFYRIPGNGNGIKERQLHDVQGILGAASNDKLGQAEFTASRPYLADESVTANSI